MPDGTYNGPEIDDPEERERIILAQSEIKSLLVPMFQHTPLEELFSEFPSTLVEVPFKGLRNDFVGNRTVSGSMLSATNDRELRIYLKRSKRKLGKDIGEAIRIVEVGSGSSKVPQIEHLALEYDGGIRRFDPDSDPVVTAVELARKISTPKP